MIRDELEAQLVSLSPKYFTLENESDQHAHYYPGKETHFKLIIVSEIFEGLKRVKRHQLVYNHIKMLLKQNGGTIHAFSIHAFTSEEWSKSENKDSLNSPSCLGRNLEKV